MRLSIISNVLEVLFPRVCVVCSGSVGDYLCSSCRENLRFIEKPYCEFCGRVFPKSYIYSEELICYECRRLIDKKKMYFGTIRSVFYYEEPIKKCISLFKYQGRLDLADTLGSFLVDYIKDECNSLGFDYVLSVPMYKKREKERGFNHAGVLAKFVAKKVGIPYLDLLVKLKDTPPQVELSKIKRQKNVASTFGISFNNKRLSVLSSKDVLLIDDVYTTGATVKECSYTLKRFTPINRINVLTLARTE